MGSRAIIPSFHVPFPSPVPPCYHTSGGSLLLNWEAAHDPCDKDVLLLSVTSVPELPMLQPLGLARCNVTSETLCWVGGT